MEFNQNNYSEPQVFTRDSATTQRSFVSSVFSWMFVALLVTAGLAYAFGTSDQLIKLLWSGYGFTPLGWIVTFAPVGLVLLMSFGYNKLSANAMTLIFVLYAALMGMSLGFIFLIYAMSTIFQAFFITAGMFGVMAIVGYTTKIDLTKFGSIMFMGLIGIVIASVVNLFLRSDAMGFIISIVGVLVFTGLTAYDMQQIKRYGQVAASGDENQRKMVIQSALKLYLDFINLFLMILRLLGRKN